VSLVKVDKRGHVEVMVYDVTPLRELFTDILEEGEVLGGHIDAGVFRGVDVSRMINEGVIEADEVMRWLGRYCLVIKWGLNKLVTMCRHNNRVIVYRFKGLSLDRPDSLAEALRILREVGGYE